MSVLEDLINKHCPDGVEYKTLSKLGSFYAGLNGKNKDDFKDGNAKYITYMNVFSNLSVNLNINDTVQIDKKEKQNIVQYGDIIFTGSSETREECGMSSVLTKEPKEKLYLNSFCFGFRFNDKEIMLPDFSKYLFRSIELRKKIIQTSSGVTRYNVSKKKMETISIPLPPIEIQKEIVRILDTFTEYQDYLNEELTLRKKQYEYYRDKLLTFNDDVPLKKLGDIAIDIYRGTGIKKDEVTEKGIPCVRYGEIYTKYNIWFDKCFSHTIEENIKNRKYFEYGDVLFAITGESVKEISKSCVYIGNDKCLAGGDIVVLKHNQNPKYMGYVLSTTNAQIQKSKGKVKSKVVHSSVPDISDIIIPVPPLEEQERIVKILDRFDALCNDISSGLPAEIEMRKKQYEYYRDKLLTFKEKKIKE